MKGKIFVIAVTGILVVYFFETAGVKNSETNSSLNEGVCDVLLDGKYSEGLHGLCVAYCEAQDCVSEDGELLCNHPADNSLLDDYNQKRKDGDPEMPCIKTDCACFNANELTVFTPVFGIPNVCKNNLDFEANNQSCTAINLSSESCGPGSMISERNNGAVVVGNRLSDEYPTPYCFFRDYLPDGSSTVRFFSICEDQALACAHVVEVTCAGAGWSCFE